MSATITIEQFIKSCTDFARISDQIGDGWKYYSNEEEIKSYLKKETYLDYDVENRTLLKVEYVIFYNLSYGVPCFSFNIWDSTGSLLSLEAIRKMSTIKINEMEFYSVITQQEHPLFFKPYFIMHPCQTSDLVTLFQGNTKNLIVTFLSLITPLMPLKLPLQYGL